MYVKIMGRDVPFPLVVRCRLSGKGRRQKEVEAWDVSALFEVEGLGF